jgi:uncharacterized protein (DUF58 family)
VNRYVTRKLRDYIALVAMCLFVGFGFGRADVVACTAPFVVAILVGLSREAVPELAVSLQLSNDRLVEKEGLAATIAIDPGDFGGELDVGLVLPPGVEPAEGSNLMTIPAAGAPVEHTFVLDPAKWGLYRVGPAIVRATAPGNLVAFESVAPEGPQLRVYPAADRVMRGLLPLQTRSFSGDYVARSAGEGIEFASARPFVYGDSVRRINWRVTSRLGDLHVNLAHPERDADVVIFLDAFADIAVGETTTLDLAVRGASALAQHHLRHNDRVGLVSFGGVLRWLNATMGRVQVYRIADFLLDVEATFSFAWKNLALLPKATLPPGAIVIALSALDDERSIRALHDISARGFSLVVINTLDEELVRPAAGPEGVLAYRAWRLQRSMRRAELEERGVPVVTWRGDGSIQSVLARVPKRVRR